jgi:hypothetical protein
MMVMLGQRRVRSQSGDTERQNHAEKRRPLPPT